MVQGNNLLSNGMPRVNAYISFGKFFGVVRNIIYCTQSIEWLFGKLKKRIKHMEGRRVLLSMQARVVNIDDSFEHEGGVWVYIEPMCKTK